MEPTRCRACNQILSDSSSVLDPTAKPGEGDISVCLYCGTLAIVRGGTFVAGTLGELEVWVKDASVIEAMYVALQVRRQIESQKN